MKKIFLLFLFSLCKSIGFAQTDTAFWFAAPDIEVVNHPLYGEFDRPIYLRLTSFTSAANVTISIPANPGFTPININIPASSTSTIDITPWINLIENSDPANVGNKGIYIQSTTDITAYYEVNSTTCNCNPELFSLKGRNAIGNEFYVPSQLTWAVDTVRHPNARAGFDIVATQNNTTVTVTPTKALINHPANVPFTITLNKGQSYACIGLYRNGISMLNGSKVVSDKPVSVTTYEDLLFSDGACADLAGDQLIPTPIYGFEFAVVRGNLTTRDKVVITASQNSTNIYLNGNAVAAATINSGQSFEFDMTSAMPSLYITTNKAASVFHYTGSGCEVGAAVIPKLTCTGSSSVSIVRTSNGGNASVMLVTKAGNQGSFLVNGVGGIITAADFSPLTGTSGAYVYAKKDVTASMPLNVATRFSNTTGKFQLGFFNVTASNGGCMYGFFSDFKKSNVSNSQLETCRFDSVQLQANGGITYQWTPVTGLSNPNISNPKASPAVTTDYKVVITDTDGCIDSAFVKVVVNICSLTCNNWLSTPNQNDYATIGDLDITGNQLTVEAVFNRTAPLNGGLYYGHLVSKHSNSTDVNYALLPNGCEITTTNGYKSTFQSCPPELNKTYHVAMVYNGTTLKYYRNGFLLSQVACTGNMITNNFLTTIAQVAAAGFPPDNQFKGFTNEVRIWNVARTQAQLQTYMNNVLPNPTTQTGLMGYYTFDNLLNKQGNAVFNATLNGASAINATNPNCTFVADSCAIPVACNNWLYTELIPSFVKVGDIDVAGTELTIEANYNRTAYTNQQLVASIDLVSKKTPGFTLDWNYHLAAELAEIYTTNGYFGLASPCPSLLNKTYHVAMVYNGNTLKYYRNGYLVNQINATGNLLVNNSLTTIGFEEHAFNDPGNFVGYINEVRIWNVVRSQSQLQTYMNTSLPNPTTQPGLQAYYTFNNLINKQGNTAFNGTLNGTASINQTNPNCTFTPDPPLMADAGNDTLYCTSGAVNHILQGNGNGAYSWSPAIYLNNPNIQNPTATISSTTTFYLTVSTTSFCSITDSVTIYVNPMPLINTINDTTICKFYPLVLNTNSNAVNYQWSPANYVSNPAVANPIFIGINSQKLYVTGSSVNGCTATDSVYVALNPLPVVKTIEDTTLCMAQSITLTTTGAQTYSWSPAAGLSNPGIASPVFTGSIQQTYTVTGTDAIGCKNTDIISISFSSPDSLKSPPSFTICGQQTIQLNGNNGTRVSYLWSPATYLSNATIINPLANPPLTTLYTLLVTDNTCGFDSTFTALLTVLPGPIVNAGKSNDIDCAFRSATLSASGGNQYTWSPSTGLSNTSIQNPVATPASTQQYIVQVIDAAGCTNTDTVMVFVNNTASLARYMPNAFTPDGNGKNDCYGLKNWLYIKQLQFYIFNRYGEQVFATANPNTCWNGMYKGKQALAGTYVYVIKAQTDCGLEEQKGSFLLIR